jgi:hypothetical protein
MLSIWNLLVGETPSAVAKSPWAISVAPIAA